MQRHVISSAPTLIAGAMFLTFLSVVAAARDLSIVPLPPLSADNSTTPSQLSASVTRYDLPLNVTVACGCNSTSSLFPVAAINQGAYGSTISAGMTYHFDLASPSPGIPASFWPRPPPSYGYDDFVDSRLGEDAGCCPVDPGFDGNATCPATLTTFSTAARQRVDVLQINLSIAFMLVTLCLLQPL
ncbi:hypothetical protein OIO90_002176 [Microbotryomycetes sp. JL221]|nr:hypothetical protein OIO90_002176 [Microbotryomycetes sp. JL221]